MHITMPVYNTVDMLDVTGPMEMFEWAGYEIDLVAQEPGLIAFRKGLRFEVTKGFEDAREGGVIWVPGGSPEALSELINGSDQTYIDFLKSFSQTTEYVTSVCEGALLLAAAGLLNGYSIATHWAFIPCFEAYPKVTVVPGHPRFILDGNRLTGGGISSGLDEALMLIQLLDGTTKAQNVQQYTQYYPDPPVSSLIPHATSCPVKGL